MGRGSGGEREALPVRPAAADPDLLEITSARGRRFVARLVPPGGTWGRDENLVNTYRETIVVFYDATGPVSDSPFGQTTGAAYYVTTLLERDDHYDLSLYGAVPEWTIDAPALAALRPFLESALRRHGRGTGGG